MKCKDCNGKGKTVKSCKDMPCFCYPTCEKCNGTGEVNNIPVKRFSD